MRFLSAHFVFIFTKNQTLLFRGIISSEIGRKQSSKYARLGKKSIGRRGFQGRKVAATSAGDIEFSVERDATTTVVVESEAGPSQILTGEHW